MATYNHNICIANKMNGKNIYHHKQKAMIKKINLQKNLLLVFFLTAIILLFPFKSSGQIIGWNAAANGGGFGASPWTPVALDSHLVTSGLIRGSSIGTSGAAATGCWGGANGWTSTLGDEGSFYFTFQAMAGYKVSLNTISSATRRSNSGPSGCAVWYSVGGAPFVKIADWTTTSTSGTTGTPNSAALSGIAALQDIQPGVVVKFRIIPQGSAGNYYITNATNCLRLEGSVVAAVNPLITTSINSIPSFGDVMVGNTSSVESFTFSGEGLTDDLSLSAPAGFEISTDNVNWFPGSDFSPVGGIFTDVQVWVRFNPTVAGPAAGNIVLSSPGAADKIITVSGNALPALLLSVLPEVVDSLSYPENGGPSPAFQLTNLTTVGLVPPTGNLLIEPEMGTTSNYEVSIDGVNWGTSANLPYTSADNDIVNPEIYVRLKAGLSEGAIASDNINITGGGLTTFFIAAGIVDPASTIDTDDEPYGPFCNATDSVFDLDFTPSGGFLSPTFYAQLSNPDGSFPDTPTNIVGMSPTSPVTVVIPAGIVAGNLYRVRIFNDNPLTFSTDDNGFDIVINDAVNMTSIVQSATVCSGEMATFNLSGLLPNSTFDLTYTINAGNPEVVSGLVANETGNASFTVVLDAQNNDQLLTVVSLERTDIAPACTNLLTANNTVALNVNAIPTVGSISTTPVCGAGEPTTVTLTGLLPNSTLSIDYTIAGNTLQNVSDVIADVNGEASFTLNLELADNAQSLEILSITRTDLVPNCPSTITGVSTVLVVNERPTAVISGDQNVCFGNSSSNITIDLTGTAPWDITYTDGTNTYTVNAVTSSPYHFTVSLFETKTFTLIAVNDAHCEANASDITGSATVTINSFSYGGTISGSTTVCKGINSGSLILSGNNGAIVKWQSSSTIDFAIATDISITANTLEYTNLISTTYYRAVVSNGACNAVNSAPAVISVTSIPMLVTQPQTFCNEGVVGDLFPSGDGIQWYADMTTPTVLLSSNPLESATYFVSQTIDGCESERTATIVTVNVVPTPQTESQTFCNLATVADLQPSVSGTRWYATPESTTVLMPSEILATGNYYASQTIDGCESERTLTSVIVNIVSVPTTEDQTFCNQGTVADLEPSGSGIQWYSSFDGNIALAPTDILMSGNYYVSQTIEGCESERAMTLVTMDTTALPEGEQSQEFEEGNALADLAVIGTELNWYMSLEDAQEGIENIDPNLLLTDGSTYYVTQTSNGCESDALAITVTMVLGIPRIAIQDIEYFPNPVSDILNIKSNESIDSVTVFNTAGQEILSKKENTNELKLDVSKLPQGMYLVKIISGQSIKTVKITKQ